MSVVPVLSGASRSRLPGPELAEEDAARPREAGLVASGQGNAGAQSCQAESMRQNPSAGEIVASSLRKRAANGGIHLHHSSCIHNLPPERQIAIRGKTIGWWMRIVGSLPEQITPAQWETGPPA